MVDILSMVDLTSISAMLAATGVLVGVVFAILQLRDLVKTRQTDTLIRLYTTWGSEDLQEAFHTLFPLEFKDYNDFVKKYGLATSGKSPYLEMFRVGWFFNGIGVLLYRKLADARIVEDLFGYMTIWIWEQMNPIVEGWRKQLNRPRSLEWFEYLYNEMKKREQLEQSNTTLFPLFLLSI